MRLLLLERLGGGLLLGIRVGAGVVGGEEKGRRGGRRGLIGAEAVEGALEGVDEAEFKDVEDEAVFAAEEVRRLKGLTGKEERFRGL